MKALCVDDELLLLDNLLWAVRQSPDIEEAFGFEDETDALRWAKNNKADIAFIDIELHEMSGIDMAKELHRIDPNMDIIFCTGHSQYALDAFDVHATGYLMKPISPEMVQKEITYIRERADNLKGAKLSIRRYGNFSVYDKEGNIVEFKRTKTKELLAVLVHTHGMVMRVQDLCNFLWSDNDVMYDNNKKYLWNLLSDLRISLDRVGAGDVLGRSGNGHFVNMALIELNDIGRGEYPYMNGYEWAVGGPLDSAEGES